MTGQLNPAETAEQQKQNDQRFGGVEKVLSNKAAAAYAEKAQPKIVDKNNNPIEFTDAQKNIERCLTIGQISTGTNKNSSYGHRANGLINLA